MLAEHSAGLIALSGCSRGEIATLLAWSRWEEARRAADFYRSVYPGSFYIELVHHPDGHGARHVRRLAEFAREVGLSVVATNDVHHAEMEGYRTHELLNAMGQLVTVDRLPGPRTVEKYLKSAEEMATLFRDIPEAITNTLEIAERCSLELPLGQPKFPCFPLPSWETASGLLRRLAFQRAEQLYPGLPESEGEAGARACRHPPPKV
jgi:DNA polymerase-3 subunit alpha